MEQTIEQKLAAVSECSDGWMSAYYRQTSRLLRAESALHDIVQIAGEGWDAQRIEQVATSTLEEIKQ